MVTLVLASAVGAGASTAAASSNPTARRTDPAGAPHWTAAGPVRLVKGAAAPVRPLPGTTAAGCAGGPVTAPGWRELFRSLPRAGDGYLSAALGDGRTAWLFGDTARLDTRDFISNMMVVTCGATIHQVGSAEAIPAPGDGSRYWGGVPVVDAGALYVFTTRVAPHADWPYFTPRGVDLATFDLTPGRDPALADVGPTPSSDRAGGTVWGAGALRIGEHVYVYGQHKAPGAWAASVRVARVPSGQLPDLAAWRYWDGATWSELESAAAEVIPADPGTDTNFSVERQADRVVITTKRGGAFSAEVATFAGAGPIGPFTVSTLATLPTADGLYTYLAFRHRVAGAPLTVNQQPRGRAFPDDIWANPDDYRAIWLQP